MIAAGVALALTALAGCDRPPKPRDDSAIAAAVDKARAEDEEADRRLRERAIAEELARRDAEQAEIDQRTRGEQENEASIARLEERLRAVLVDPSSMQTRNARLTSDGTTLCTEFNAKNKQGAYLGFRRAVVSDTVLSFEQDPDDNYREPQRRFAEIARATGCYTESGAVQATAPAPSK
jgi:hypothetical protein